MCVDTRVKSTLAMIPHKAPLTTPSCTCIHKNAHTTHRTVRPPDHKHTRTTCTNLQRERADKALLSYEVPPIGYPSLQVCALRPRVDVSRLLSQAAGRAAVPRQAELTDRAHQVVLADVHRPLVGLNVQPMKRSPMNRIVHVVPASREAMVRGKSRRYFVLSADTPAMGVGPNHPTVVV